MSSYFDEDPTPTIAGESDYFAGDVKPTIISGAVPVGEITTGQGKDTSMVPIEGGDFFDLFSKYVEVTGFGQIDPLATAVRFGQGVDQESGLTKAQYNLNKTMDLYRGEQNRIENVLKDRFGKNYLGVDAVGGITSNVRDGLARRNKFSDRIAYFKRQNPEGRYFRVNVGGKKVEELYSLTKDGPIYRVDPDGGFSDFAGDFADFFGTVATGATAGAILGSFVNPFFGTAGGSLVGQMLDDYFTGEDVNYEDGRKFWGDILSGDKVLQATAEGALNTILPGMGKYIVAKIKGEEAVPFNFMIKKSAMEGLKAQQFAVRSGLPMLAMSQLTDSKVIQKLGNQIGGTSDVLTKQMTNQKRRLLQNLKPLVEKDFSAVGQEQLKTYLDLTKANLYDDVVKYLKTNENIDEAIPFDRILKDLDTHKKGFDELINRTYGLAMQTAQKDKVVFDISNIQSTAENVLAGIKIKMVAKDPKGNNVYQRIGGELSGDIGALLNQLRKADPNVKTIAATDFGTKRTFDALKQMLAVRNKLSEIAGEAGDKNAIEMIKAIDQTLQKPVSGGTGFRKYLDQAQKLTKQRTDTTRFTSLASLFDRRTGINIPKAMDKVFNGDFNAEDFNILVKFMQIGEGGVTQTASKQKLQFTQKNAMEKLSKGFQQYLFEAKDQAPVLLAKIKDEKSSLYNKLIPSKTTQQALDTFLLKHAQLNSSGAQKALAQKMLDDEAVIANLLNSTRAEINDQVTKMGGINSLYANRLRRGVLLDILQKSNAQETIEGTGELVLNTAVFKEELKQLNQGLGKYAKFKDLFPKKYTSLLEDFRLYSNFVQRGADAGAEIASGGVIGQLREGTARGIVGFAKTMFVSNLLANFLAKPISLAQLKKIHDNTTFGSDHKILRGMTAMLGSIERELDFVPDLFESMNVGPQETIQQEYRRKGTVDSGDPLPESGKTSSITPNTLNLNLPNVSGGGSGTIPPSTNQYSSLFPFDATGSAIANRSGIMGLT